MYATGIRRVIGGTSPERGGVVVRRATIDDVDGVAAVFGLAFDDYRHGFGVDAPALARLWRGSFVARVARTLVATGPDGQIGRAHV